jgi:hypothetical protein
VSRLPFIKFFPNDWLADERLRLCCLAARGLWLDMLCLMHKRDHRRGYLEHPDGSPLSVGQLARAVGAEPGEVAPLLAELEAAGVFSRDAAGVIHSRRIVRDELFRSECSEAGKKGGGNPDLLSGDPSKRDSKGRPKGSSKGTPKGDAKGASKGRPKPSDARGQKPESIGDTNFLLSDPPKAEPKQRPRNTLFDAIAEVTGLDPRTAGGLLGEVSWELSQADPPFTADDVRAFARRFWECCPWAARDNRTRPTPKELQTHIGKVRATPAPPQQPPTPPRAQLFDNAAKTESRIVSQIAEAIADETQNNP